MKLSLSLKLGILVVALFGAVVAGMFLYQPIRYAWLKSRLLSDDKTTRDAAIKTLAGEPNISIPRIIEWLGSGENRLLVLCCGIIQEMDRDRRRQVTGEVSMLLDSALPSVSDAAWETLLKESEYEERYTYWTTVDRVHSFYCFMLRRPPAENCDSWDHLEIRDIGYKIAHMEDRRSVSVDSLIKALTYDYGNETSEVHSALISAFGYIGDEKTLDMVSEYLEKSEDVEIRRAAALALGRLGDSRATKVLMDALRNDRESYIRAAAAEALGMLKSAEAVQILLDVLFRDAEELEDELTIACAWALSEIGDDNAVTGLMECLDNASEDSPKWIAAFTLGLIGDDRVSDKLMFTMDSGKDEFWPFIFSANALAKMGDMRALQRLMEIFESGLEGEDEDEDFWLMAESAMSIGIYGGEEAVDVLCRKLAKYIVRDRCDEYRDLCLSVARALGEAGDPKAVDVLLKVFEYEDYAIAANFAALSLTKLADKIPADRLIEAYEKAIKNVSPDPLREDPSERVPGLLLMALGSTGDKRAMKFLLEKLNNDDRSFDTLIALLNYETPEVKNLLRKLHDEEKSIGAKGLLWMGEPVSPKMFHWYMHNMFLGEWTQADKVRTWHEPDIFFGDDYDLNLELYYATEARWGKKRGLEWILNGLLTCPPEMISFYRKVLERMPKGFPGFDFNSRYHERMKKKASIMQWYNDNKNRLEWDAEKRVYFLKPGKQLK
ncbi:MAG: HEAT repeat domain-containing protein [Planctomycetota bacterium]|nr:MAG: HEAT repeat domain-containing protein [Planctomycetota bacterium]